MFKIYDFITERVNIKPKNKIILKLDTKIEITIEAIEELRKRDIRNINSMYNALTIGQERLNESENKKNKLESNNVKSINYRKILEPINLEIKIHKENIIKLNQQINLLIYKIHTQIINIVEEINSIENELKPLNPLTLNNLRLELKEENEILQKTKIRINYTLANTIIEIVEVSRKLENTSNILKKIKQSLFDMKKNNILKLN